MAHTTWEQYFATVEPLLGARQKGFNVIFNYLKKLKNPFVVETGTYREENNYTGDGCSTLLFDNYITFNGGTLYSVDIDPTACSLARANTKSAVVVESDSVKFLAGVDQKIDLLYLDSYNIEDWFNDWAPAAHHLKELCAVQKNLKPGSLIVVDDNMADSNGNLLGKGRLIYELMEAMDIEPFFAQYQIGWLWE